MKATATSPSPYRAINRLTTVELIRLNVGFDDVGHLHDGIRPVVVHLGVHVREPVADRTHEHRSPVSAARHRISVDEFAHSHRSVPRRVGINPVNRSSGSGGKLIPLILGLVAPRAHPYHVPVRTLVGGVGPRMLAHFGHLQLKGYSGLS